MYYGGFTYTEAYHLPIWQRIWFIERISKEIKDSGKEGEQQSRGHQHPEARALMGRARANVPSKLRRFT